MSAVSSGAPARMPSRCATCDATALTSQPGRSVGADHSSADSSSSRSVKSLIACHQTSMYALSCSASLVASVMASTLCAQVHGEHGDVVGQLLSDEVAEHRVEEVVDGQRLVPLGGLGQAGQPGADRLAAPFDEAVGVEQKGRACGHQDAAVGALGVRL